VPVAKYKRDKTSGLYYTYEKTGQFYANGKPKYEKLRAKTIARLDAKVQEYRMNKVLGVEPSKITVDEWQKQWFAAYIEKHRDNTRIWYSSLYKNHIKPVIGSMRVVDVREMHVQSILSSMSQTHGEKTVKSVRSILFGLFDKARQNRVISINPAEKLSAKGRPRKPRRPLTQGERAAYLNACKTHPFGDFAALLYFFGLRRGEAAALLGSDILESAIRISKQHTFPSSNKPVLGPPKTSAGTRDIFIPDAAADYIDLVKLREKAGYLFATEDGGPLTYTVLDNRWKAFLNVAFPEGTEITEHYLRHNYCVMLFEANVDLVTTMKLMGHDSLQTTVDVYTHYSEGLQRTGAERVALLGAPKTD